MARCFLQLRTEGVIYQRAKTMVKIFALILVASFALAGIWMAVGINGFRILNMPSASAVPNILAKEVVIAAGAWFDNYSA